MDYAQAAELWQSTQTLLKETLTSLRYDSWYKNVKLHSAENGMIILHTQEKFIADYITNNLKNELMGALWRFFGREFDFVVVPTADLSKLESQLSLVPLNPHYTFESFVVGQSNLLAHAASLAVAEQPGAAYNPLFIYGPSGLGKTHLMNAIANYALRSDFRRKVVYTTCEEFTNRVVDAIARKKTQELRTKLRNIDMLLVDDVQFLSNKTATQEEFFHTFNALFENKKQIVLSSDRQPGEIATLEERMRSRFMSGLVADIQRPDVETRMAILKRKAEMQDISIDTDAISYIAQRIDTNIRELEGGLNSASLLAKLENTSISEELAKRALKNLSSVRDEKKVTPELITLAVARRYKITPNDIMSDRRSRSVAVPRQICIYLTREITGVSTTKLGEIFGRDHSTIIHACRKTAEMLASDRAFAGIIDDLQRELIGDI